MNHRTAWIVYTLLRLAFFAVPFAALMILLPLGGIGQWPTILISSAAAALISVSLSVILLSRPREAAAESIYDWRLRNRTADDIVEDEALDAAHAAPEPATGAIPDADTGSGPGSGRDRGTESGAETGAAAGITADGTEDPARRNPEA
ncbi:DUF4229 domain-containing protein [Leucobacter soli]|uniref:DUF4229 domain-containing protein n=1 Tax=Leucobacter soli TaxID=2812850 RepID=A0A916NPL2_9MICO|nr:DUF4229 domain-containing protein [Leucobacter soli]CAG7615687.1 hypothetical protein LEUCIP111803_01906 [Leucobacter soli]